MATLISENQKVERASDKRNSSDINSTLSTCEITGRDADAK